MQKLTLLPWPKPTHSGRHYNRLIAFMSAREVGFRRSIFHTLMLPSSLPFQRTKLGARSFLHSTITCTTSWKKRQTDGEDGAPPNFGEHKALAFESSQHIVASVTSTAPCPFGTNFVTLWIYNSSPTIQSTVSIGIF
jgi:hypothetical protein